jgi:hypothetical protein
MLEERVARLEVDMTEVKADLKAIRSDLAGLKSDLSYLRGKADQMPTTLQLIGFAVAVFVAAGVLQLFQ